MKNNIKKIATLTFLFSLNATALAQEQDVSGLAAKDKLLSLLGEEARLGNIGSGSPCEVQFLQGCGASYLQIRNLNNGHRVEVVFRESSSADGQILARESSEFYSLNIKEDGIYGGNIYIRYGSGLPLIRLINAHDVAACQL